MLGQATQAMAGYDSLFSEAKPIIEKPLAALRQKSIFILQ